MSKGVFMFKKLFGGKDEEFSFVTPTPTIDSCPYCGFKFEKIPTRKKKCPECGNYIYVRFGKLYTEEEKDIKDLLDNFTMQELGVTRNIFNKTRQELSQEFGVVASVNDTSWRILNLIVVKDISITHKKIAYQAMASILKDEGKNTDKILAQAHEMELLEGKAENEARAKKFRKELLEMKNIGSKMLVKILTANDEYVCEECGKLSKMTFTIDEFLETMPIPYTCTNAKCRCSIGFTFPDSD